MPTTRHETNIMLKKILIIMGSFYMVGVFGFAIAFGTRNWSEGWDFAEMALEAVGVGISWPFFFVQNILGA